MEAPIETSKELFIKKQGSFPLPKGWDQAPAELVDEQAFSFEELSKTDISWIIITGVGQGKAYAQLNTWLRQRGNRLIYLESNPRYLQGFLQLPIAHTILSQANVDLFLVDGTTGHMVAESLAKEGAFRRVQWLSPPQQSPPSWMSHVQFFMEFSRYVYETRVAEHLFHPETFSRNFYRNLLGLDKAWLGTELFGQFKGVPAIICGAGPSLAKNGMLLQDLSDKALILAGGTAVNALYAYGAVPHFGVALDPYAYQMSRILANPPEEIPYFYRNRTHAAAVAALLGPKLYVPGSTGYKLNTWFDEQLHLPVVEVEEGANVINWSLSLAIELGCNPLIFVGLDLAYTEGLSYAPGLLLHAAFDPKEHLITKHPIDELIQATDIEGKPTKTLMKWLLESEWFTSMAVKYPDRQFINCTEGGIGFLGIPSIPLKVIQEQILTQSLGIADKVKQSLVRAATPIMPSLQEIQEVLSGYVASLRRCVNLFSRLEQLAHAEWDRHRPELPQAAVLCAQELEKELAYQLLLQPIDQTYQAYMEDQERSGVVLQQALLGRYPFLRRVLQTDLQILEQSLEEKVREEVFWKSPKEQAPLKPGCQAVYYPDGKIRMYGDAHEVCFYYPNGALRRRTEVNKGKIEGSDCFYDAEGKPLFEAHYARGVPVGQAKRWYPHGGLAQVITYDTAGAVKHIERWDIQGKLVQGVPKNYFEQIMVQTAAVGQGMHQLIDQLKKMGGSVSDEEWEAFQQELVRVEQLHKELQTAQDKEPLWQGLMMEKQLQEFVSERLAPMRQALQGLQKHLEEQIERESL